MRRDRVRHDKLPPKPASGRGDAAFWKTSSYLSFPRGGAPVIPVERWRLSKAGSSSFGASLRKTVSLPAVRKGGSV